MELECSSLLILRKIHEMGWKTVSVGTEFSRCETQFLCLVQISVAEIVIGGSNARKIFVVLNGCHAISEGVSGSSLSRRVPRILVYVNVYEVAMPLYF